MIATMKFLALTLLLLWVLVSLSDAQCYFKSMLPGVQTRCQDDVDKTWHPLGSRWRNSKCMDCDCSSCCAAYSSPRKFPSDCVSVFDPKACKYIVHKKNNPSELCPVFAAVG
ncbi:beta-microseminoprotein A1-like [Nothobranchius furzeri]|uniref:beta-microseminoprotein A1-like n=1 Tax=Nothobranchius furzeri TaxID=105023 RepID=UPI003904722D